MLDDGGVEIPDDVLTAISGRLRTVVGLSEIVEDDPLHRAMVLTMLRLGPNALLAQQLIALRLDVVWAFKAAAEGSARARVNYEHGADMRTVQLVESARVRGERLAVSLARMQAEAEGFEDRLAWLTLEARASACRKLLDALDAALEAHRTDRADARAADRAHADGYGGAA